MCRHILSYLLFKGNVILLLEAMLVYSLFNHFIFYFDTVDMDNAVTKELHPIIETKNRSSILGNKRKLRKITFMFPNQTQNSVLNNISKVPEVTNEHRKRKNVQNKSDSPSNVSCDIIEHI